MLKASKEKMDSAQFVDPNDNQIVLSSEEGNLLKNYLFYNSWINLVYILIPLEILNLI